MKTVLAISSPISGWRINSRAARVGVCAVPGHLALVETQEHLVTRANFLGDNALKTFEYSLDSDEHLLQVLPIGNSGALFIYSHRVRVCSPAVCQDISLGDFDCISAINLVDLSVLISVRRSGGWMYRYLVVNERGQVSPKGWGLAPLVEKLESPDLQLEIAERSKDESPLWSAKLESSQGRSSKWAPLHVSGMLWYDGWLVVGDDWPVWGLKILNRHSFTLLQRVPFFIGSREITELRMRLATSLDFSVAGWRLLPFSRLSIRRVSDQAHRFLWSSLDSASFSSWDFGARESAGELLVIDPKFLPWDSKA